MNPQEPSPEKPFPVEQPTGAGGGEVDPAAALMAQQRRTHEEVRRRVIAALGRFPPPMTTALTASLLLVHLSIGVDGLSRGTVGFFGAFLGARSDVTLLAWGARASGNVLGGEVWRLFTCLFLHGDALHVTLNGVALFGLGRLCEAIYGPVRLLWLFLMAGLAGSLLSQFGNPGSSSVGASGAIFGLMGAGVVFGWRYRHQLPPRLRQLFWRGLMPWILLNLFIGFAMRHVIDNHGHIGGLVGGAVMGLFLGSPVVPGAEGRVGARLVMVFLSALVLGWCLTEAALAWAS